MDRPAPGSAGAFSRSAASASARTGSRYGVTTALAVITCALAPAYTLRWHVGPLPTTLLENAILLTLAAFVVETVRSGARPLWQTPATLPALVFLIAGAISVIVPPDHRAAAGLFRAYFIEPIAFGFVLLNSITTARRALAVGFGLAAGGVVAGLANSAVVIVALAHHAYDVVETPPVVIYNTANAVALYLVPITAFSAAAALHWPRRTERLVATAFAAMSGFCVLLSFSRGGYLALAAVAVGLAVSHRRRWFLLAGGVVAAAAVLLIPTFRRRIETEVNFNDPHNTLVGRSHLWDAALQMLQHHPIFGAGLSGFAAAVAPYWNALGHTDTFTYPHNIVLNFWTETGLLGVFAMTWILAAGFRRAWRGWRASDQSWRAIHLGVLLALVAVVVHGLVDVPYWKNDLSLEFWAFMALTFAIGAGSFHRIAAATATQASSPSKTATP